MMFKTLMASLGSENVSQKEVDRIAYSSDASRIRGEADTIVWPRTAEDIRQVISYAKRHKLNVVPRGAGTGLAGGAVPQNSVVIDFSNMDKFAVKNGVAVVQPGVVLDDLNSASEYILPVIPGSHAACTIGGMIATNAAGMRALKYGKMENWVEELDVIDGDGKLLIIKKDRIKNFCGREGTTGIIVKAKLRLTRPLENTSVSILKFDNITTLVDKFNELKKEGSITALEYIDKITSEWAGLGSHSHLLVEYETGEGNVKGDEVADVWKMRDGLFNIVASKGYTVIEDPLVPSESVDRFLYWLQKNSIPTFGHIGIGVVHPHFKRDSPKIEEMFAVLKKLKGTITGEHGVGLLKKKYVNKEFVEEMKKLKAIYDPQNILNRGKII